MPYHGSNVERLQAVIAAQRDVMACGLELQRVMDVTTARTRELTRSAAAVVELREGELTEGEPVGDAIARADRKLYAAKHTGRNRVAA